MRLKEDSSSWRSSGITRRDFRHSHDGPEVDQSKRKPKKARTRIDHKHIWEKVEKPKLSRGEIRWYEMHYPHASFWNPDYPQYKFQFRCTVCGKTKWKSNPRYSYELWKWRKNWGR